MADREVAARGWCRACGPDCMFESAGEAALHLAREHPGTTTEIVLDVVEGADDNAEHTGLETRSVRTAAPLPNDDVETPGTRGAVPQPAPRVPQVDSPPTYAEHVAAVWAGTGPNDDARDMYRDPELPKGEKPKKVERRVAEPPEHDLPIGRTGGGPADVQRALDEARARAEERKS